MLLITFCDSVTHVSMSQVVEDILRNENLQERSQSGEKVLLGRDTRPSGQFLLEAALKVMFLTSSLRLVFFFFYFCESGSLNCTLRISIVKLPL